MDYSNFNFSDSKKKDFMMNFVIPEGIRVLESKLKVNSNQIIPAFDPEANYCDDNGLLSFNSSYKNGTTEGDFILFLGVTNAPSEGYLAYATFCLVGKIKFFKSTFSDFLFDKFKNKILNVR